MPHVAIFNHEPQHLVLFKVLLERYGYTVTTHVEDANGLEEIRFSPPALVVLGNIRYLTEDEFKFLSALRSTPEFKTTPVVISTTAERAPVEAAVEAYQPITVIQKPFSGPHLLVVVDHYLKPNNARKS